MRNWVVALALTLNMTAVGAAENSGNVTRPVAPNTNNSGTLPEIVITPGKQDIVEEYRINGLFYMIKVTPHKGLPYYLVDSDGDGVFETRQSQLSPDLLIPRWVLFKF